MKKEEALQASAENACVRTGVGRGCFEGALPSEGPADRRTSAVLMRFSHLYFFYGRV